MRGNPGMSKSLELRVLKASFSQTCSATGARAGDRISPRISLSPGTGLYVFSHSPSADTHGFPGRTGPGISCVEKRAWHP